MSIRATAILAITFAVVFSSAASAQSPFTVTAISVGDEHGLALVADGSVWAWGDNEHGQLGDGTNTYRSAPVEVSGLEGVISVVAGPWHNLAVKEDGTVWAWGANLAGQLGDGTFTNRTLPVQVNGVSGIVAIAAGINHSLAVRSDGTVWAWGYNQAGQLGDGTQQWSRTPVQVIGLTGVVGIAGGGYHSLALKADGTVWAWGHNGYGQLGDGTTATADMIPGKLTPVQVEGLTGVVAIAAGWAHSLALRGDASVWAWGFNAFGEAGDGTTDGHSRPVLVQDLGGISSIAAALTRPGSANSVPGTSFAVKIDGTVWVWGKGQSIPVMVEGTDGIAAVAAGMRQSLALKADGTMWAWGRGPLGGGTPIVQPIPVQDSRLTDVKAVSAGPAHNLALGGDGTIWGWGGFRELSRIEAIGNITAISAGDVYSLALDDIGEVWEWDNTTQPLPVQGLNDVIAVAAGSAAWWESHRMALKADGTVWDWTDSSPPVPVSGLADVIAISGICDGGLAVRNDGTVWEWYFGAPTQVQGLSGIVDIAGGCDASLALGDEGRVWERIDQTVSPVEELSGVTAIAVGFDHFLALKGDGTVWAWRVNYSGQLGDGTTIDRPTPVRVAGIGDVVAISAGYVHSLAVKRDGSVWAWGGNSFGQINETDPLLPVQVVPPGSPDLTISMSHPGAFTVGSQSSYTLTVTNVGRTATTGTISVRETLPEGLTFISAIGDDWLCSANLQELSCTNPGPINPGISSIITVTVEVDSRSQPGVTNVAEVSNASDLNASNNVTGDPTTVVSGQMVISAVVNAASLLTGPVAPGELITILGEGIGSSQPGETTRVIVDGEDAIVLFASPNQVNASVPDSVAGKLSIELQIEFRGVRSDSVTLAVADNAPGIFTVDCSGVGQAVTYRGNSPSNPAQKGSFVDLYATGANPLHFPMAVHIAGREAESWSTGDIGLAYEGIYLLIVTVQIPVDVESGPAVPIMLTVGEAQSQEGVTIAIQ